MVSIIAYTFEADYHCIDCTRKRFGLMRKGIKVDECGIPYLAHDADKNPVHPVFDTDEGPLDAAGSPMAFYCGDCAALIYKPLDSCAGVKVQETNETC